MKARQLGGACWLGSLFLSSWPSTTREGFKKKDRQKEKKPACSSPKQPALMAASCNGGLASGGVCRDAGVSVPFTDPKFLSEGLWC